MSHTSTHTYAKLVVNKATFSEIYNSLAKAGYHGQLELGLIDMNGFALVPNDLDDFENEIRFGTWFLEFAKDQAEWSHKTFGSDKERGPIGPLKHLAKEAKEAQDKQDDPKEYADLLILTMDASRRAGISPFSLLQAARAKMRENKAREWPKPTAENNQEAVEHVRDEEPSDGTEDGFDYAIHQSIVDIVNEIQEWLTELYEDSATETPIVNFLYNIDKGPCLYIDKLMVWRDKQPLDIKIIWKEHYIGHVLGQSLPFIKKLCV